MFYISLFFKNIIRILLQYIYFNIKQAKSEHGHNPEKQTDTKTALEFGFHSPSCTHTYCMLGVKNGTLYSNG